MDRMWFAWTNVCVGSKLFIGFVTLSLLFGSSVGLMGGTGFYYENTVPDHAKEATGEHGHHGEHVHVAADSESLFALTDQKAGDSCNCTHYTSHIVLHSMIIVPLLVLVANVRPTTLVPQYSDIILNLLTPPPDLVLT